jgi:hypothetical protein
MQTVFAEIPMPEPAIVIDRRASGLFEAFFLFLILAGLAALVILLIASGAIPPRDEGAFGLIKSFFILGMLIAIASAGVGYGLTRILLWAEIGEEVVFRSLLGVRRLPWSEIARFEMTAIGHAIGSNSALGRLLITVYSNFLDVVGELHVTTVAGACLELRLRSSDWDRLRDRGLGKWSPATTRPIRLPRWRAIAFMMAGLATLVVGLYLDYLCLIGDWQLWSEDYAEALPDRIGVVLLPILVPVVGVIVSLYGVRHLRRH